MSIKVQERAQCAADLVHFIRAGGSKLADEPLLRRGLDLIHDSNCGDAAGPDGDEQWEFRFVMRARKRHDDDRAPEAVERMS